MITVGSFQPFPSRKGRDTVVKLTFPYDPGLIDFLKRALRNYREFAVDPSAQIFQPGGWRPDEKCWFVERAIWPMIERDLRDAGYEMEFDHVQSAS